MPRRWLAILVAFQACAARPVPPSVPDKVSELVAALQEGELERALEVAAWLRPRVAHDAAAALWSSVVAELLWRDDEAVNFQSAAVRLTAHGQPDHPQQRGRLGDLLFQAGRWGEALAPLRASATTGPDAERRAAFAVLTGQLPFQRRPTGPLLTEQRVLAGDVPEFLCGSGDRQRPFAIDTGTSMTTLAAALAEELQVHDRQRAGTAVDGTGRSLDVEAGVMDRFHVGEVDLGSVPVLVVADESLRLRDLFGGPERAPRGVLGLDLIAAFRLTLDPDRGSVVLELPRGLPEGDSVQCVRAEGRCLVPVTIEGVRLWFVLDTGASHSSLTTSGLRALPGGEERAVPSFRRVRTVGGSLVAVREVRDLVLRSSAARFRSVTLPVVPRSAGELFPVHGVVGIDLLSRCRVTLDRGRARLQVVR